MDTKIQKFKEKYSTTDYFTINSKRARALANLLNCETSELFNAKPYSSKPAQLFIWGNTLYQILIRKELKKTSVSHFVEFNFKGTAYFFREVGNQSQVYKDLFNTNKDS